MRLNLILPKVEPTKLEFIKVSKKIVDATWRLHSQLYILGLSYGATEIVLNPAIGVCAVTMTWMRYMVRLEKQ
jgi:hypothetical protein